MNCLLLLLIGSGKPAVFWRLFVDRRRRDRLRSHRVRLAYNDSLLGKAVAELTSLRIEPIRLAGLWIGAAGCLRHSREMTILCSPKMTHHHRQLGGVLLARWPGANGQLTARPGRSKDFARLRRG